MSNDNGESILVVERVELVGKTVSNTGVSQGEGICSALPWLGPSLIFGVTLSGMRSATVQLPRKKGFTEPSSSTADSRCDQSAMPGRLYQSYY